MVNKAVQCWWTDVLKSLVDKRNHSMPFFKTAYRQVSNTRRTLVGNQIVDHSDGVGAAPVQLHLHSPPNTWLQYIAQRQLQAETKKIFKFRDLVRLILEILWYVKFYTVCASCYSHQTKCHLEIYEWVGNPAVSLWVSTWYHQCLIRIEMYYSTQGIIAHTCDSPFNIFNHEFQSGNRKITVMIVDIIKSVVSLYYMITHTWTIWQNFQQIKRFCQRQISCSIHSKIAN